jgi:hypothetical protein
MIFVCFAAKIAVAVFSASREARIAAIAYPAIINQGLAAGDAITIFNASNHICVAACAYAAVIKAGGSTSYTRTITSIRIVGTF